MSKKTTHKVKMLKTLTAYDDVTGERKLSLYNADNHYTISDSLLTDLINDGAVELVVEPEAEQAVETRETKVIAPQEPKPAKEPKLANRKA